MKRKRSLGDEMQSGRYHYEYKFSEDNNSVVDPPRSSTVLDLVSTVRINFKINYMLRKRKIGLSDETLDSIERCFCMRLYLITGSKDYHGRVNYSYPTELRQCREDMEYDVNVPETFLKQFLRCNGVVEGDVIEKFIGDIKDFVVKLKKGSSSNNNKVLPITVSMKVHTLQQEDEPINDAKRRAITAKKFKRVKKVDRLIKLLERPPPYKFMIEFNDDDEMLGGDCCICLSKLSVGEEVLLLACSHAYHYDCLIRWLDKGNQCPLCRCPMNLQCSFKVYIDRLANLKRQRQMRRINSLS